MPRKKSNFQIKLEVFAARAIMGAIGAFPLSASMEIGQLLAFIPYKFLKRLRFVGFRNLEMALPEFGRNRHEAILRGTFESLGRQLGLVSHFPRLTPERVRELIDIEGLEFIRQAQDAGHGVIFFSAHFGGWEASNLVFPASGFNWNVLVRRIDNLALENFVEMLRGQFGAQTIDKKSSARAMLRVLQTGGLLGIVADLNVQEQEGVFVNFFGISASTTTGLARLALRTKAAVIPGFFVWDEQRQKYLLKIEPPLEITRTGDDAENIRALTQKTTAVIEKYIRAYPEQWLWIHKRWNTRPPGEANLYVKTSVPEILKFSEQT